MNLDPGRFMHLPQAADVHHGVVAVRYFLDLRPFKDILRCHRASVLASHRYQMQASGPGQSASSSYVAGGARSMIRPEKIKMFHFRYVP